MLSIDNFDTIIILICYTYIIKTKGRFMKRFLIFSCVFSTLLLASGSKETDAQKKLRAEKHLKEQLKKEKKYSDEQTFYMQDNYDFKGAEVNQESVEATPALEVDDLDMDSVYD